MHKVVYSRQARNDLHKLDFKVAQRILKKIHFYSLQKDPLNFAKKLTYSSLGTYRFHIGDYRVIFDVDYQGNISVLIILKIKHRKDIYNL